MTVPTWKQQSLMWGYGTTTTDAKGVRTYNSPTANVSGFPVYNTTKYGNRAVVKPTENLTGYPAIYSGSKSSDNRGTPDIWSDLDPTAIVQNLYGSGSYKTLQSSGNITGWPTVWRKTDGFGKVTNEFTIPGYTPAGTIAYSEDGFPGWNVDENGYLKMPKDAKNPYSAAKMPKVSTIEEIAPQTKVTDSAYNAMSLRRRRSALFDESF